jgi:hypothetical protein
MSKLSIGVMVVGLLLGGARQAAADAVIPFTACTVPAFCAGSVMVIIQPGAKLSVTVGGPYDVVEFGINFTDLQVGSFVFPPQGLTLLGPGDIGPYGSFTQRWAAPVVADGINVLVEFQDLLGRIPNGTAIAPFFNNADGFVVAVQGYNPRTDVTGFAAASLNNAIVSPEPGTLVLMGSGLAWLVRRRVRRA